MSAAQEIGHPTARVWSPMQQAVFAAVGDAAEDAPHLVVEALAGTGKTTTIVEALRYARGRHRLFVAFNKAIAEELAARAPTGVDVKTLNGFGFAAVRNAHGRIDVKAELDMNRLREWLPERHQFEARREIAKLVSMAKATLVGPDELPELADTLGLDLDFADDGCPIARALALADKLMRESRERTTLITFDDQVWLPIVQDLRIPRYDWVFVDETQDLNAAQLELVMRAAGGRGRICAIGDRHQAIYGFRGADSRAIPRMIERLDAEVLPLSVTYRCPRAVVAEAQRLVPALQAAPHAADGIVRTTDAATMVDAAAPGDFVVSRTNAPLIALCLRWIAAGRRAQIRGREIGAGLVQRVKRTKADSVDGLLVAIDAWCSNECRRLAKAEKDTTQIEETAACIRAVADGAQSVDHVLRRLEKVFGDADAPGIALMSTHKAKGLEADRVWLLRDTYCRWDGPEEKNLLYVAITRARHELVYVIGEEQA